MKLYTIILLLGILSISQSVISPIGFYFNPELIPSQWGFDEWSVPDGEIKDNYVYTCDLQGIIGGFTQLKTGNYIELDDLLVPQEHTLIVLKFTLYQIDFPEGVNLEIYSEDQLIKTFTAELQNFGENLCGSGAIDKAQEVTITFQHQTPTLHLKFIAASTNERRNLNQILTNSWAFNNLKIYFNNDCDAGQGLLNGQCQQQSVIQQCSNSLMKLDADGSDISHECIYDYDDNGNLIYIYELAFIDDYQFDSDCLVQKITFGNKIINEGDSTNNLGEWTFDEQAQKTTFRINHTDLVDLYECELITEDPDWFEWQCGIEFVLKFQGENQFTYSYCGKNRLSRKVEGEVTTVVNQNIVKKECCVNDLEIQSELKICADENCENYVELSGNIPHVVNRQDTIYLEHKITTPFFQDMYVDIDQLLYGDLYPPIVKHIQLPGKTIIGIQAYKASAFIKISSQATLYNTEQLTDDVNDGYEHTRRTLRILEDQDGSGTQLLNTIQLTVNEKQNQTSNSNNNNKKTEDLIEAEQETQEKYDLMIIIVVVIGVVCLFSVIFGVSYSKHIVNKSKKQQLQSRIPQQYLETQEVEKEYVKTQN